MREYRETVKHPGKFQDQHPMIPFIYNHDAFDEESGNTVAPDGWFARAGKWIIGADGYGFVSGYKCASLQAARADFDERACKYDEWNFDDEGDEGWTT